MVRPPRANRTFQRHGSPTCPTVFIDSDRCVSDGASAAPRLDERRGNKLYRIRTQNAWGCNPPFRDRCAHPPPQPRDPTSTLAQFANCDERLGYFRNNGGRPNLDEASQNRAIRGTSQAWPIGSNTITGKSLD